MSFKKVRKLCRQQANPGRTRMSNMQQQNNVTQLIIKNVIPEIFSEIRYHLPIDFQHKCQGNLIERGQSFFNKW